jgi:uncharacterized membrane protein
MLPAIGTLLCAVLAVALVRIDSRLQAENGTLQDVFLFGGGAEGARGVLSAIAGSIVTVTGTIFSIVIVALQLASGQFTPRVMRHFTGDRINQSVLAAMIATFTYCLLVLRTVRSADDERGAFVPALSITVAILLALVCVGGLILFIHHAAKQLQVPFILQRAAKDTRRLIDETFSEVGSRAAPDVSLPGSEPGIVRARGGGYLQDIDLDQLRGIARDRDLTIHVLHPFGTGVLTNMPLAHVWRSGGPVTGDDLRGIRDTMVVGIERTLHHDVTFGFRQIADIAVKALSPGINDPTTATQALDTLTDLLVRAGNRGHPETVTWADGRPVIVRETVTFARLVDVAFTQIRHYGADDVVVMTHLLDGLGRVAELVPDRNRAILDRHGRLALAVALAATDQEEPRAALREAAAWVLPPTGSDTGPAI